MRLVLHKGIVASRDGESELESAFVIECIVNFSQSESESEFIIFPKAAFAFKSMNGKPSASASELIGKMWEFGCNHKRIIFISWLCFRMDILPLPAILMPVLRPTLLGAIAQLIFMGAGSKRALLTPIWGCNLLHSHCLAVVHCVRIKE